eukprot:GFUD01013057.1.p1 GENE.GFUD01013057.1~~GFUD01013057.1.p1  ORF type:complete len:938 (+),score=189.35 GFUD01013057.1:31-2814(+)
MAFERSKSLFIPTLQKLCLNEHMKFLESSCAAYIQLSLMDNPLFAKVTANMLPVLKQQMEDNMSGTSSSSIREEMLEMLFSGKFPSPLYRKSYVEDLRNVPDDPGSHEDRARHQEIKEHGKGCCSPCCTGAFIVETMACIIINDEVRELKFDFSAEHRIWDKNKAIRKYVNFDIPSIMSHLYASIKKHKEERKPQLARLIINGTGLQTRQFASSYDNTNFILNSYNETKQYVTFPTMLSSSAVEGYSYPTNPYSEDLFLTICDVFSFGLDSFDKLTEIQFGIELSTRSTNVQDRYGQPVSVKLFASIGLCCPNLKILDVSNAVSLPTECFIHLFYHDTYLCLHKYVYLPPFEVDSYHCVVHKQFAETEDIHQHSDDAYCPWCFDPWACNGVRAGCEFLPIPIPVVDDRLYKIIQDRYQEDAPKYLAHVIKASDLVRSVEDPMLELVRPSGPSPFEEGFNETKYRKVKDGGWEYSWYELGDDEPVNYKEFGASHCMKMNHLCETLQVLKLGHLGPRYEIVPFLLTALPQIKTLGAISVLNGLKMIQDIPELGKMEVTGLEDITIDIVNRESGHNKLTATLWASPDIKSEVEHFFENLDTPITSVADKRKNLAEDIKLITKYCPKLRSISLFLFLEEFPGLLRPTETWIWQSLEHLHHLENMTIICHEWEEVSALFKVVGHKLGRLCLSLDGRGRAFENGGQTAQNRVPALDTLMHSCPELHTLKIDLRMSTLALSATPSQHLNLNKLKKLSVGLYLTKNAFEWLWTNAANIEELLVPTISNSDTIDLFSGNNYQVYYTKDMLAALFKKNTMKNIRKWNVHMCLADIASAFYLVESLRHFGIPEEISKLTIRVQLPQNNYGSQEELLNDVANLMQQMRRFKLDCESKSDPAIEGEKVTKIKWTWEKVGLFQSFAEIEQLNAMVEPQNIA